MSLFLHRSLHRFSRDLFGSRSISSSQSFFIFLKLKSFEQSFLSTLPRILSFKHLRWFILKFLMAQSFNIWIYFFLPRLFSQLHRHLFSIGEKIIGLRLQIFNHYLHIIELSALSKQHRSCSPSELSSLLPMLDVLEISIEQVLYKVLLDILDHWERHEIISFDIMCLQLLQMAL